MNTAKTAVVTGASTGIGYATAEHLIARGWRVFAGVRKEADAERLLAELGPQVTPLIIDVTDAETCRNAAAEVRAMLDGRTLSGLVNNAGIAVAGPLLHLPVEEMTRQLDVNVTGQLRVTQAFAPLLGAEDGRTGEPGRIVNISSVAGLSATPLVTPYACSKHALEAFTQGLRRELMLYGIDVVAINPGPIATPIWAKAEEMDPEEYRGRDQENPELHAQPRLARPAGGARGRSDPYGVDRQPAAAQSDRHGGALPALAAFGAAGPRGRPPHRQTAGADPARPVAILTRI